MLRNVLVYSVAFFLSMLTPIILFAQPVPKTPKPNLSQDLPVYKKSSVTAISFFKPQLSLYFADIEQKIQVNSSSSLDSLFSTYSSKYGVDKSKLQHIAACESSFNSQAIYGDYGGMFQFASQTWSTIRSAMGLSTDTSLRFNADESIKTAAYYLAKYGDNAWPECK